MYFALLLYAIERYLKDRVWLYFPIAVALVAAGTSFNLFLYALFFLPYILFRHYVNHGWRPRALSTILLRLAGLGVLGLGISAIFLFANVQEMMNSPRVLGEASLFDRLINKPLLGFEGFAHNATAILRFFSSDLLGSGSEFRGWRNYLEAPMFYCGLLSLLLAPQVFVQLARKHKLAYALFGLVFLVPVVLPFFRYLFWGFTGDYYRLFSAFVALVLLFFSLHALDHILKTGQVQVRLLIESLVVLLALLFFPYMSVGEANAVVIDGTMRMMAMASLLVYTGLVIGLGHDRSRMVAQWGLLLVVCVELTSFSWQSVNNRPVVTAQEYQAKGAGYNDYSVDAVAWLKQNDPGFYRIEKTYSSGPAIHHSLNDAKVQGYFGTSSYDSFNQLNYIRFLDALDVINANVEYATRWAIGMRDNPLLMTFSAVKYVLVKQPVHARIFTELRYRIVHKVGDVIILMNPFYLPFGFTYDAYMTEADFRSLPTELKSVALLKAVVVERLDKTMQLHLTPVDGARIESTYTAESYLEDVKQRRNSVLKISNYGHKHVTGTIDLAQPGLLFFSLPFDRGWKVTVDGEPAELQQVNIGFSGLLLPAGEHTVELHYHLPFFLTTLMTEVS